MEYRRALVIRFGGLGDILMTTPCLRALSAAFPAIETDYIVGGGMSEALTGHPCISRVLTFDKRGADAQPRRFARFLRALSHSHYDLVVNLHPSAKSLLMEWAARPRRTVRFQKHAAPDRETGRALHATADFADALGCLGISEVDTRGLDFIIPGAARVSMDHILQLKGVDGAARLIVINPAASRPVNRWPVSQFQRVAAHFAAKPDSIVVVTGASRSFRTELDRTDEVQLAAEVASASPRIVNLAGALSIKELGALLERASLLLTCDTGPMHIGAAVGSPLVVLSGAADPDRTGPRTANAHVLIDRELECVPCRARSCSRGDRRCMTNLDVEAVIGAVERQLTLRERETKRIVVPIAHS